MVVPNAIRPFVHADSDRIATILANGWAQAYGGFLPAHILAPRQDHAARRAEMRDFLEHEFDPATEAMLVADDATQIQGFVHAMLGSKAGLTTGGYINLLYVTPERQGQGLGRSLLAAAAQWLAEKTAAPIAIAAFQDNPFHGFYAHVGGRIVETQQVSVDDFPCLSVIYLWDSPTALANGAKFGAGDGNRTRTPSGEGF